MNIPDEHRVPSSLPEQHERGHSDTSTVDSVYLGELSTQIAFRLSPSGAQDGLYRVQIGNNVDMSWTLYTHFYKDLGFDNVKTYHLSVAADDACEDISPNSAVVPRGLDYCLFAGYAESVMSTQKPRRLVEMHGPSVPAGDQLDRCMNSLRVLLDNKHARSSCREAYGSECAMQGAYQPPLPSGTASPFVGSGLFKYPWQLLKLPSGHPVSLLAFRDRAAWLCSMSFSDLVMYDAGLVDINKDHKYSALLPYSCFLTSYILVLLQGTCSFLCPWCVVTA